MAIRMAVRLARRDDDFAETHEINVKPLIDLMMMLMIIFMVADPLVTVAFILMNLLRSAGYVKVALVALEIRSGP